MCDVTHGVTQMAILISEYGAFRLESKYLTTRNGIYQLRIRIPEDVRHHYPKKKTGQIRESLKTSDLVEATRACHRRVQALKAYWRKLRTGKVAAEEVDDAAIEFLKRFREAPGSAKDWEKTDAQPDRLIEEFQYASGGSEHGRVIVEDLPPVERRAHDLFTGAKVVERRFRDAIDLYDYYKGAPTAHEKRNRENILETLFEIAGDLPLSGYSRDDINRLIKHLSDQGNKSATIRRKVNRLKSVYSLALKEYEINQSDIFSRLQIPNDGEDQHERQPLTRSELETVTADCLAMDDQMRWAVSIAADTGMRLAEVIGLKKEDLHTDASVPHVDVKPNAVRSLKTKASERQIPLVGVALWAARRAKAETRGEFAFPRYTDDQECKSTYASNAISKWMKPRAAGKTAHCLRHTFRDRLRNVGCPSDVIDQLGGWRKQSVGQSYGRGYSLEYLMPWMEKIVIQDAQVRP